MLTGVIYGAIVVAWAAYLVPLALRRHDDAVRSRSVDRFSSAMRVLARGGSTIGAAATAGTRMVVTPRRSGSRLLGPERAPTSEPTAPAQRALPVRTSRAAQRVAAARRRRVVMLLAGLIVVVGVVGVFGLLPRWSVVVPLVALVGFLVVARRTVRRARRSLRADAPDAAGWVAEAGPSVVVRRAAVRVDAHGSQGAGEGGDTAPDEGHHSDDEPTITLTAHQAAAGGGPVVSGGSLWDPVPVMVPAYAGATPGLRTLRTIELPATGGRSARAVRRSEAAHEQSPASAHNASSADAGANPGDDVPRAVNS